MRVQSPNHWATREFPSNAPGPCWLHTPSVTSSQPSFPAALGRVTSASPSRQTRKQKLPASGDLPAGTSLVVQWLRLPVPEGTEGPEGCLNTLGGRTSNFDFPVGCGGGLVTTKLCLTLCDPVDCSPPGSSVHGILQTRILERVAISFSRGSSQPRDQTRVSCTAGRFFTH